MCLIKRRAAKIPASAGSAGLDQHLRIAIFRNPAFVDKDRREATFSAKPISWVTITIVILLQPDPA